MPCTSVFLSVVNNSTYTGVYLPFFPLYVLSTSLLADHGRAMKAQKEEWLMDRTRVVLPSTLTIPRWPLIHSHTHSVEWRPPCNALPAPLGAIQGSVSAMEWDLNRQPFGRYTTRSSDEPQLAPVQHPSPLAKWNDNEVQCVRVSTFWHPTIPDDSQFTMCPDDCILGLKEVMNDQPRERQDLCLCVACALFTSSSSG